jgi:hypothetical protein
MLLYPKGSSSDLIKNKYNIKHTTYLRIEKNYKKKNWWTDDKKWSHYILA